jgi:uncharacterized membrane protein
VPDGAPRRVEEDACRTRADALPVVRPASDEARLSMLHMKDLSRELPIQINPALIEHAKARQQHLENRIADRITAFSGSMRFVYLHAIWFACWIGFGVEAYPFGLLTMIVSLEAIFLSTFVMISQNRADEKREVLANQEWKTVQTEDSQNQQLLSLSNQILELTKAVHAYAAARSEADGLPTPPSDTTAAGR